nr:immunoglobulin heavy chain junction region [Macaca mulatta]MOV90060.1 immunoglobulin heavy chain junction region [Macaca mulatta]MOV90853.1 immunoglobulin heavy chain junction region [Macaca mulatta]
CARKQVSFDYW